MDIETRNAKIRAAFKDNEPGLKAIRAVLVGLNPTEDEKNTVKTIFADKELLALAKQELYPQLQKTAPIGQMIDFWGMSYELFFGKSQDIVDHTLDYKNKQEKIISKLVKLLEDPFAFESELATLPNDNVGSILAKNQTIKVIDTFLGHWLMIANKEVLSPIQEKDLKRKNSAE